MSISGFIIGLVAGLGFIIPIIFPYLGWLKELGWFNWLNVSLSMFGFILSLMGTIKGMNRVFGIAGIVLCGSIVILSVLKLT